MPIGWLDRLSLFIIQPNQANALFPGFSPCPSFTLNVHDQRFSGSCVVNVNGYLTWSLVHHASLRSCEQAVSRTFASRVSRPHVDCIGKTYSLILCNLCVQSAPRASKRFGAIPLRRFFTNALPLKCSIHGCAPMRTPQALCSIPLNKVVLIPSTSVVHYVQIRCQ